MIIELEDQNVENLVKVISKAVQDASIETARVLIPLHDLIVEQAKAQHLAALRASASETPTETPAE
jgi:hypothetical protein